MLELTIRRCGRKSVEAIIVSLNEHAIRFTGDASIQLEKQVKDCSEEGSLFKCFNEYIDSTFSTDKRVRLFELYQEAHDVIELGKFHDYITEMMQVHPVIDKIIELINVDKYCEFIRYSEHLKIPKNLGDAASKGDYPVQTTIGEQDYVEMVFLAFVVRTVYPIIFGLLSRFNETMGHVGGFSEYVCGALIKDNPEITKLPGWKKLSGYVKYSFDKRGIPIQIDAVSSAEHFVEKVLYSTIFDRLCPAIIPESEPNKNLATAINASVRKYESGGPRFDERHLPTDSSAEDKRSLYDKFQISEEVKSTNQTKQAEFFSFGLMDENDKPRNTNQFYHQAVALGIKDHELIAKVYDNMSPNWDFVLEDHILKLLESTFFQKVSPFIFEACNYQQLMAAIAIGQVWLAEMGYTYLPSLLGAISNPGVPRLYPDNFSLSNDDKDFLTSICDIQSRNNEGRSFNEAVQAAQNFLDRLGNGTWKSNLEYGVLSNSEIYSSVKRGALFPIEIDVEIKNEYMALIRYNHT
jgi:hypothetical protein